jgi:hypothetical protein
MRGEEIMIDLGLTRSSVTLMLCSLFFNAGAQGQEPKPAKEPSFYYGPPIKVDDHVTVTVEKHVF